MDRRDVPDNPVAAFDWITEDGSLPDSENKVDGEGELDVWLFTCCGCGTRLADPPGPPSGMDCACGGDFVCHVFRAEAYRNIRLYGDPRGAGGAP